MEAKKRIAKDSIARRTAYNEGYREGIKEVVGFVNKYLNPQFWSTDTNEPYYTIKLSVWKSKLKDWGC